MFSLLSPIVNHHQSSSTTMNHHHQPTTRGGFIASRYRLTNGLLISIAERYGNADSVAKTGPDFAVEQATRNVAAAMFALIDDPQVPLSCRL